MSSGLTPASCIAVARLIGSGTGSDVALPAPGRPRLAGPGIGCGAGGRGAITSAAEARESFLRSSTEAGARWSIAGSAGVVWAGAPPTKRTAQGTIDNDQQRTHFRRIGRFQQRETTCRQAW